MKNKKTLVITSLICLLPIIVGALVYKRLPETIATHFDLNGNPDGWSSRAFAVFGLPAILLAVNLLLPFMLRADPKHENMSGALVNITIWTIPVLSLVCSGLTLGRALGYADLTDDIHGLWLREIAYGRGDITLQAHRGSYKTSCLTLAIALLMLKVFTLTATVSKLQHRVNELAQEEAMLAYSDSDSSDEQAPTKE
jgi:hypothetical protein